MCGIAGLIIPPGSSVEPGGWAKTAIFVGALRGEDSSGLAVGVHGFSTEVFKSLVPGFLVEDTVSFSNFVTSRMGYRAAPPHAVIAHNRHATRGSKGIDAAQPFKVNHITLAHNGTLDTSEWQKDGFVSDSHYLTDEVARSKDEYARDVFNEVKGAFACIWYNEITKKVYFVRNDKRPLFYAELDGGKDGVILASEEWMMDASLRSQKYAYALSPVKCATDRVYSVDTTGAYLQGKGSKQAPVMFVPYSPSVPLPPAQSQYGFLGAGQGFLQSSNIPSVAGAKSPTIITSTTSLAAAKAKGGNTKNKDWVKECLTHGFPLDATEPELQALNDIMVSAFREDTPQKGKPTPIFGVKRVYNAGQELVRGGYGMFVLLTAERSKSAPTNVLFRGFLMGDHAAMELNPSILCTFWYDFSSTKKLIGPQQENYQKYFSELEKSTKDSEMPIIDARILSITALREQELLVCRLDPATISTTCSVEDLYLESYN